MRSHASKIASNNNNNGQQQQQQQQQQREQQQQQQQQTTANDRQAVNLMNANTYSHARAATHVWLRKTHIRMTQHTHLEEEVTFRLLFLFWLGQK
jgi:hypothetical protein